MTQSSVANLIKSQTRPDERAIYCAIVSDMKKLASIWTKMPSDMADLRIFVGVGLSVEILERRIGAMLLKSGMQQDEAEVLDALLAVHSLRNARVGGDPEDHMVAVDTAVDELRTRIADMESRMHSIYGGQQRGWT